MKGTNDTLQDWVWWLFCSLILASCVTYPLRWFLYPETLAKLTLIQEGVLFFVTVVGQAIFIIRPFCKGMEND